MTARTWTLNWRERECLTARAEGKTFREIGERFGVSGGRIEQITRLAERKHAMVARVPGSRLERSRNLDRALRVLVAVRDQLAP